MNSLYIPPEIAAKHQLRAAVRQPADTALTARLTGGGARARHELALHIARSLEPRLHIDTEPNSYAHDYVSVTEVFVFTRAELAELLESRFIRYESLPSYGPP